MKLHGKLVNMSDLAIKTSFDSKQKPTYMTLIMNLENLLELEVEIPWVEARQIAKGILDLMERAESGAINAR